MPYLGGLQQLLLPSVGTAIIFRPANLFLNPMHPPSPWPASPARSIFDIDNIDIGPERRAYLETKLERCWEINREGSIPYVPYLRAPYYVWVGRCWETRAKQLTHEQKVEAPPLFPPTFLYTQSWEDPEPDMKVGSHGGCLTADAGCVDTTPLQCHE